MSRAQKESRGEESRGEESRGEESRGEFVNSSILGGFQSKCVCAKITSLSMYEIKEPYSSDDNSIIHNRATTNP
jgi:hypothetical protein